MWHVWGRMKCIGHLMAKPEGGHIPVRSRQGWKNNIKMHIKDTGQNGMG
jgi:hypothetical protein